MELKTKIESLTTSSLDNLLSKIRNLAARPSTEFSRFDAMDLLEAIKNSAHDNKHEKANYYKIACETLLRELMSVQMSNFGKILDIMAKVEKNRTPRFVQNESRRDLRSPYRLVRCFDCQQFGHTKLTCFKWRRDKSGPATQPDKKSVMLYFCFFIYKLRR